MFNTASHSVSFREVDSTFKLLLERGPEVTLSIAYLSSAFHACVSMLLLPCMFHCCCIHVTSQSIVPISYDVASGPTVRSTIQLLSSPLCLAESCFESLLS